MPQKHPEVVINGKTYPVQQAVEDEIVNLRRGTTHEFLEKIKFLKPRIGDTVIVTTPSNVGAEFVNQVGSIAKQHFPDAQIAVLPEDLGFHTQEGFAELVGAGMRVATAVREKAPKEEVDAAANAFNDLVTGRKAEEGPSET